MKDQSQGAALEGYRDVTLGGLIEATLHRDKILAALRAQGYRVVPDEPIIEPFMYGRVSGLRKGMRTSSTLALALAFGVLASILGLFALFRFGWWRRGKQSAQRQPVPSRALVPTPSVSMPAIQSDLPQIAKMPRVGRKKLDFPVAIFDETEVVSPTEMPPI